MDSILKDLKEQPHIRLLVPLLKRHRCKVYLVGGYLRNLLLNKEDGNRDLDFAVSKGALELAKLFSKKIKGFYVVLDKKERCARVIHRLDGKTYTLDFAQFRGATIKKDLALRDFTINNLAVDVERIAEATDQEGIIIDENGGQADLKRNLIRMVSIKSFKDDPLRIIRSFSLAATLNFKIDAPTISQAKKYRHKIADSLRALEDVWDFLPCKLEKLEVHCGCEYYQEGKQHYRLR